MSKNAKKSQETARRYRSARVDGKVGSLESRIEKDYGLPPGSVMIVGPDGKDKRSDAKVQSLLAEWNWP
jgi:hypothetical protein